MDVLEAWPRPCALLSPRTPSCLLRSFKFLSSFTGHHIPLRNMFSFTLCAGNRNSLTRSPIMSIKKGLLTASFEGQCVVVWTVEADLAEGQFLYISGECLALGCWEPEMAILMSPTEHANIWKAEVKIASGVNFKYNYFIKEEIQPLSDIRWRPGPQFSLSVPPSKKQKRKIVVRDTWMRSKTESHPPHLWGSWIEETNSHVEPSFSVQAEDEDKIVRHLESDLNKSKLFLSDLRVKDEIPLCDMVAVSNAEEGLSSTALLSERNQPVEEPWFVYSLLSFLTYGDNMEADASKENYSIEDEITMLEPNNQHYQNTEKLLPSESSHKTSEDSVYTVILINSSICTMQRIAVLEDGKLVELLLEPVKTHVQCDSVYLGIVTKLVPHMGGAFVNIGSAKHSLMDIKNNREPFIFPPFRRRTKTQIEGLISGTHSEHSATDEIKPPSEDVIFIEDAAEDDSEDEEVQSTVNDYEDNDVDEDFDVSVLKENVNGSIVDYSEVDADFEDLLDGEHHLEEGTFLGLPPSEISNSLVSYSQDLGDANRNKWDLVRKGTKIIVQVVKEGLGTKGPTLTAYPKLRSRFWILLTRCDRIGVSKKITGVERTRLKVIAKTLLPQGFGLTVRTVAAGHSLDELQKDLEGLLSTWKNIVEHAKSAALAADEGVEGAIPVLLHRAMGQTLSVVQDYFNDKANKMVVDSPRTYHEVTNYLQDIAPDLCDRVELYDKRIPLFDEFEIEEEINNMLSKRVPLPNGGSLVIEQTEALVSIDVNGGHGMFGHGTSQEKATLDVNLAAAKQIARELRLRDIGGIIVVDFIDMEDESNKRLVYEEVKKAVDRDRSMVKVSELSKHGLMEITRKRVRPSVTFMISEPCICCHGTGRVEALETSFSKIEQEICRSLAVMKKKADPENPKSWPRFILRVDQHMCNYLTSGKRTRLAILSSSLKVWILLKVARGFTRGAFELKPFTDEIADKKQHQVAISMLRTAETGTSKSGKKLTLIPKRAKANRK